MDVTRRAFLSSAASVPALRTSAALPGPRSVARPNFLFFFPDQHRSDWVQWNPAVPVPTPNLSALRERGLSFSNAIVDSPVCGPSRACLASGSVYERCGVRNNGDNFPTDRRTVYRALRESGYHVIACGKLDLHKADYSWGLDGKGSMEAWGFSDMVDNGGKGGGASAYRKPPPGPKDPYYDYLDSLEPPLGAAWAEEVRRLGRVKWNRIDRTGTARRLNELLRAETWWGETEPVSMPDHAYCDNWIARNGLRLLDRAPDDRPWHLTVNFVGPHPPMDITQRMAARFRGPERVIDGFEQPSGYDGPIPSEQHVRIRQNYAAMIENIDRWLGVYVEALKARGDYEDTVIAYSSDHGEMLGDRGLWGKSFPFQSSAGVPLCMAGPGIRRGVESDALASLIDLTATFMDYGEAGALKHQDGMSLRPVLESGGEMHREFSRSALLYRSRVWRFVQDHRYKLIDGFGSGGRRLYDREEDPLETRNIASKKQSEVARLRKILSPA